MEAEEQKSHGQGEHPVFHYEVDGEAQTTAEHILTPVQIMQNAGVDPKTHYLVQMIGKERKSYKDNPTEPIHMHNKMEFFTNALEPTPVS